MVPAPQGRKGRVRLEGRTFADGNGAFFARGATLFWALWGFQHDRERLESNLRFLAGSRGIDYVRILGTVCGETWSDRAVDPRAAGYDEALRGLLDLVARHGLRSEITLFGGTGCTPSKQERLDFVDRVLGAIRGRENAVLMLETANEAWQTGFGGEEGLAELRELTRRLQAGTELPVAASSNHESEELFCRTYAGGVGDLATVHFGRDTSRAEGEWRPVRLPWGYPEDYGCTLPAAFTNNEPIGPGASVATDDDPERLVSAALVTAVAGGAGYVLHTGPGIWGGGRAGVEQGHAANISQVPHIERTLAGLAALGSYLPPGLPGWQRHESGAPAAPFAAEAMGTNGNGHGALGVYSATHGPDSVTIAIGIRGSVNLAAQRAMGLEVLDVLTGQVVAKKSLAAGEHIRLEGAGARLVKGRDRN